MKTIDNKLPICKESNFCGERYRCNGRGSLQPRGAEYNIRRCLKYSRMYERKEYKKDE